jgi:tRNA (cmo5U34)-methyltransferase
MGAAAHLGIDLREYDARIRTFIPYYEEMLDTAADALAALGRPARVIDLGVGTGALSARILRRAPRAQIVGLDSDDKILAVARRRLGGRLAAVHGDFERVLDSGDASSAPLAKADAIAASFALHHVPTTLRKQRLYARLFAVLRRGGVFVTADCFPAADARLERAGRLVWRAHLERSYGRRGAVGYLRAWAGEDVYMPLAEELAMLDREGFSTDVIWRKNPFAVIAAVKP